MRFKEYSTDYQKRTGTKVTYQTIVGDYTPKLLTQLSGGSAADAFYVGDTGMAKLQESNNLVELTEFLGTPDGKKASETFPGLVEWTKSADGGIYGVCVDCNPMVFWFNKGLLQEAGVTTDPAAAFEGGTWTRDALDDLLVKVKATGKRGYVHMASYGDLFGLVTAFGGTMIEDNKAVFDEDPKAQEIIGWLFDSIANGNISYGGSLPKGQSSDALFLAGQLATTHQGRWILPNLKKLKNLQYDIAPYPSEDGKTIGPIVVFTAAMGVNAKAKDQEAALKFLADFVSVDGQRFRLSGGGNAVPSVAGLDEVVTEGDLPAHGKWFIDIAKDGYAIPTLLSRNATLAVELGDRCRQADEDPRHGREDVQPDHGEEAQRRGGVRWPPPSRRRVSGVEVPVEHKKALNRRHRQDALFGYGFLAPQLIGLIAVHARPADHGRGVRLREL